MKTLRTLFVLLTIVAFSCKEPKSDFLVNQSLLGNWQVYESGYSPGGDYVIDEVPTDPLKYIQFGKDQAFESNYEGLEEVHYFNVVEENGRPILHLYTDQPGDEIRDNEQLVYKYRMEIREDKLKLMYVYCIEGCHLGLIRLE
ncbi:MAG: hypothetical protein RIC35_17315 [Marinoscillum sp.]